MTFQEIISIISSITVWHVLKLLILVSLIIYFVFAVVVIRQVKIMTSTFQTGFELPLKIIAWFHLLLIIGIFISAVFFL